MIQMLKEIFQLFKTQKFYLFVLIGLILFYSALLLAHKKMVTQEVSPGQARVEAMMKQAPQTPEAIQKKLEQRPRLKIAVDFFTLLFVCSFIYGIWLGTVDLRKLFNRQELIPYSEFAGEVSWGIVEVVKLVLLFFIFATGFNLAVSLINLMAPIPVHSSNFVLIHTLVVDSAIIGLILYLAAQSGFRPSDVLGLQSGRQWGEELWWGIRSYFVVIPIFVTLLVVLIMIANALSYEPPAHPLVEVLLEDEKTSLWTIAFSLFIACIFGPVVEEIFFRGFFYPALRKYVGVGAAMAVTASLFALVHENAFAFVPIFFLGFILCYLYEKRSNVMTCITLHVIHNAVFLVYFLLMKDVLFG